ncbi:acetate--CoA ligase family protein [Ramlibacter sp. PS3R-8]|uniref:acetate--CoA ligase family protein n=1 Tax=Ramlibacter sp. PS3R-8 TaxID=3133437 RepID=UPI0030AAF605
MSIGQMLRPRSVALVGATDRSRWSQVTFDNIQPFAGRLHLVNRRGGTVHGRAAATSVAAIGEPVDVGLVMVPMAAVRDALEDLVQSGVKHAVVLSSGFAELGAEGAAEQEKLRAYADSAGLTMMGPNSLGFVNFLDDVALWASPYTATYAKGKVAVISHSGQVAFHLNRLARNQGVGLSHLVATGNEAQVDFTDFVDELLADERVGAIALYLETIRRPERFVQVARRALAAAKPLIVLKVGTNEVAARTAQAHTGALVGDDRAFSAVCAQHGVIRVASIEDLVCTAAVISHTGVLPEGGAAFVSNSGGICGIAADTAGKFRVAMPEPSSATATALRDLLPGYATINNPLDLTGAAAADRSLFESCLSVVSQDPKYASVVCFADLPASRQDSDESLLAGLRHMGRGVAGAKRPALVMSCVATTVTPQGWELVQEFGLPFIGAGLERGVAALGQAMAWSRQQRERADALQVAPPVPLEIGSASEHDALQFLSKHGVPVVPAVLATTADEAMRAARQIGEPVAVKVCSADIAHKSDIGGVALGVQGDEAVAHAFHAVQQRVPAGSRVQGVLVAPMRKGGIELFVGVTHDAQWGPMLAVGLGGVWIEVLQDVALRQLPVTATEAAGMLRQLRGAALLQGQRGTEAADVEALGQLLARIGDIAFTRRGSLQALEINPLWVSGRQVEALDALLIAADPSGRYA